MPARPDEAQADVTGSIPVGSLLKVALGKGLFLKEGNPRRELLEAVGSAVPVIVNRINAAVERFAREVERG